MFVIIAVVCLYKKMSYTVHVALKSLYFIMMICLDAQKMYYFQAALQTAR